MRMVVLSLVLSLVCAPSWAAKSSEYFYFKQLANEASHALFMAKLEVGKARSNIARAQFIYSQRLELEKRKAGTAFEMMDSIMRLMESKFEETRAMFHIEQAVTSEKIWNLRLEGLESGKDPVSEVAALYASLSAARLKVFIQLDKDLVPYLKLLGEEYSRMTSLHNGGSITKTEYNQISILHDDYLGLQKEVAAELLKAKAEVAATESDFPG